ncbi:MAG: alpha-ketoacid dehydrogenase subunit beta [Chloroflexota bacterium]|nr:alpha-ketoacid dehydrogenase subunit beta [Chloroflexota bacterium]
MREMTFTAAALEGLGEEMERDPMIFVVGEGAGERGGNFGTTVGLYAKHGPARLRDTPITERGFTGLCTGAAMTGSRPIVDYMFIDFGLDAMGELINQTAKIQYMSDGRLKMPIVLRGCIGIGNSAATHHSGSYYSIFTHCPGFRVVVPTTPYDAKGLLKTAIRSDDPVLFMEHRAVLNTRGPVPEEEYLIPFGQARIAREGKDVTVVGIAAMVNRALAAADTLAGEGISVEVIDPRTLVPLDIETILASVHKTGRLLVVDEDYSPCGIASEIGMQVMERGFDDLDAPVARLTGAQTPVPYSAPLEEAIIPNPRTIAQAIRDLLVA